MARRKQVALGATLSTAFILTACGDAGSGGGETLDDTDPVTITVQSPYGPNHFMSRMWVDYADAVEEESEGQITFDISYSASIVPVDQQEAAIRDGLLDMAWSMPAYDPGELPVNALLSEIAFMTEQTPLLSQLQGYGSSEYGLLSEPILNELSNAGLVPLLTLTHQQPGYPLLCADSPVTSTGDFSGSRIRVPGAGWATEVETLGGTPVNMPQAEVYEALERGVVDCAIVAFGNSYEAGLFDVADYWVVDTEASFQGWNSTQIVISESLWEDLPLEAQQILWNEAGETLLTSMIAYSMDSMSEEILTADEQVEVLEYEDDVRQTLNDQQGITLDEVSERMDELAGEGNTIIDDYIANQQRWLELVTDLGYSDDDHPTWVDWAEVHAEEGTDLEPFIELYMDEVMTPHRPE